MIELVYSSSKGIFRSTTVGFQTVHFLEVQIKKWIVLEEKKRDMILFVASKVAGFPSFSHILLYIFIAFRVLVPHIIPKSTNELSKATGFKHTVSKMNNKKEYFWSIFFFFFFFFFFFVPFLGLLKNSLPGVEMGMHLPAYTTAIALWDLSHVCDLHHSS